MTLYDSFARYQRMCTSLAMPECSFYHQRIMARVEYYVIHIPLCQVVKIEWLQKVDLLHPLTIPTPMWKRILMDFVVALSLVKWADKGIDPEEDMLSTYVLQSTIVLEIYQRHLMLRYRPLPQTPTDLCANLAPRYCDPYQEFGSQYIPFRFKLLNVTLDPVFHVSGLNGSCVWW